MTENNIKLKRFVVPLDGSNSSFNAAKYAIKLAKMANAEVTFVHAVVNPPYRAYHSAGTLIASFIKEAKQHAEMWYILAGDMASKSGVKFTTETILDVVSAADSIVNYAKSRRADLIVIGTK